MKMFAAGLLLFSAFSLALGRPTIHDEFHVHDRRTDVPNGFKYVSKAHPDAMLDLRIALVQGNPVGLETALYDVSTPGSKSYRKYLTKSQVDALVAPQAASVQAVKTWLSKNNVTAETLSSSGDWLGIRVPVSKANALLDTQFNEYTHEQTNFTALRTMSYSVPASVKGHLDFIYPVTSFVAPRVTPAEMQLLRGRAKKSSGRVKGKGSGTTAVAAKPSTKSRVVNSTKAASIAPSSTPSVSSVAVASSSLSTSSSVRSSAAALSSAASASLSSVLTSSAASSTSLVARSSASSSSSAPASSSSVSAINSTSSSAFSSSTTPSSTVRSPTTTRASTSPPVQTITPDESCKTTITPECIQAIYNVPSEPASSGQSNLFVASFIGESADPADLQKFLTQFRPDISDNTDSQDLFGVQSIDGGTNNEVPATIEATLDIQYTVGIATNVNTTFVTVGSESSDGIAGFLDIINTLIAQDDVPFVLTTSFGFNEKDLPPGLANNLCNAYAQLGTRGTTILFGSGDGGVSGIQATECTEFVPTFPSTCPFVTSVGGTKSFGPEVAAGFSSGGFSNVFARPSYQDAAVTAYLDGLGDTNKGLFNTTGRAFPDIAGQSQGFQIVQAGQTISVSGTSAASPMVASLFALLNDAIFTNGGQPLGFLNPFLYQSGAGALNDITSGNNPGCGTDGFPAAEGWDPITGLGTPDFVKLSDLVK